MDVREPRSLRAQGRSLSQRFERCRLKLMRFLLRKQGFALVHVVHGRARARGGVPLKRLKERRAWEGPVDPRGQAFWRAGSAGFVFCCERLWLRR